MPKYHRKVCILIYDINIINPQPGIANSHSRFSEIIYTKFLIFQMKKRRPWDGKRCPMSHSYLVAGLGLEPLSCTSRKLFPFFHIPSCDTCFIHPLIHLFSYLRNIYWVTLVPGSGGTVAGFGVAAVRGWRQDTVRWSGRWRAQGAEKCSCAYTWWCFLR